MQSILVEASIVVTSFPAASRIVVTQDRVACRSRGPWHAPQSPTPHPNFDPVNPKTSRRSRAAGISGSAAEGLVNSVHLKLIIVLLSLRTYDWKNFTQPHQILAELAPDHVRPLPLEPRCARFFQFARITAEKSCSAPSSNCLALTQKQHPPRAFALQRSREIENQPEILVH